MPICFPHTGLKAERMQCCKSVSKTNCAPWRHAKGNWTENCHCAMFGTWLLCLVALWHWGWEPHPLAFHVLYRSSKIWDLETSGRKYEVPWLHRQDLPRALTLMVWLLWFWHTTQTAFSMLGKQQYGRSSCDKNHPQALGLHFSSSAQAVVQLYPILWLLSADPRLTPDLVPVPMANPSLALLVSSECGEQGCWGRSLLQAAPLLASPASLCWLQGFRGTWRQAKPG